MCLHVLFILINSAFSGGSGWKVLNYFSVRASQHLTKGWDDFFLTTPIPSATLYTIMNATRSRSFFSFAFANKSRAATAETLCFA